MSVVPRISVPPPVLGEVRRRRVELGEVIDAVEAALADPPDGQLPTWAENVATAVARLDAEFAEHVAVTEGPDGLHQAILDGDLRLANAVTALTTDHSVITAEIAALLDCCTPPPAADRIPEVRARGKRLLARIVRHRQRGADLIYEAFDTDLGGGD